jgi:hypothetical protein
MAETNKYMFVSNEKMLDRYVAEDDYSTAKVFSGVDIVAYVVLPGRKSYTLGTLNMLSISTHRDKFPVTALGKIRVRGFTAGHRTCGGTMVFSSFDRTVWHRMVMATEDRDKKPKPLDPRGSSNRPLEMFLPDELPPFDISVTFVNEAGTVSYTGVLGVSILDEGETYSLDNISVMETYSYMAVDRIPFQPLDIMPDTGAIDSKRKEKEDLEPIDSSHFSNTSQSSVPILDPTNIAISMTGQTPLPPGVTSNTDPSQYPSSSPPNPDVWAWGPPPLVTPIDDGTGGATPVTPW